MRRRLAAGLLLLSLAPASAAAAASRCRAAAAHALTACLGRAATALRSCTVRQGTLCSTSPTATRVSARLGRRIRARCTEATIRDAHFPPPFDPAVLAARLEATCQGNAAALVARAADALDGDDHRACLAALRKAATQLAVRSLHEGSMCALAGTRCNPKRSARRLAAAEARARRVAVRHCGRTLGENAIDGVLYRARSQTTCALAQAIPGSAVCAPTGPEALVDLWSLASARPPATRVAQVSSYDRTGGNADLGIGPDTLPLLARLGVTGVELDFSYLYRDGDRYVVFDEVGPGVVWRIWMTGVDGLFGGGHLSGDIAFELDDETTPRLRLTREELFAGTTAPFLAPLAGDLAVSSGGFYAVVPIPFARRLRITTSTVPNWLHVTFSRLPPDQAVASFDPTADLTVVASLLARAGDPATTVSPTTTEEAAIAIEPSTTETIWSRSGSGTIVRLELLAPAATDIPTGLRLRATFDKAASPQIDAPLDDLFGATLGAGARSIALGRDGDRYYCYLPMPFRSAARIELANTDATPFTGWAARIGLVDELPPGPPTYLHAASAGTHLEPDGHDYVMLDATGSGHVVGVVLTAGCGGAGLCQLSNLPGLDGAHLEGDERIAIDGSRWPALHGTGLEDFFSGGFYFLGGAFTLPTHGNPVQALSSTRRPGVNLRSAYRLFLGDAIPFERSIRVAIEHGPTDDVPADFSSLVLYYGRAADRLVESDRVTIGDVTSETAHGFTTEERTDMNLTSAFRGDDSDIPVTAAGVTASVTRFQVAVDPANEGVRLRRLADLAGGRQAARVLVDGAFAGVWQTSEVNPFLRWAEPEFEIPAALTAGRSALAIELDARASPTPWTAFEYVAFSHRP